MGVVVLRRGSLAALGATALFFVVGCGGSSESSESTTTSSVTSGSNVRVALVSDIGKFNDRSFNQSQKEGLDRAVQDLGVKSEALQSNSPSDYVPNLTTAVRKKANLVISAGFLLAADTNTVAKKNPNIHFAITDYDVKGDPFNGRKNVEGLTYAANESGCLVGYLAAEMAKKQGGKQIIGAVGGLKIPPVDIWIAGYQHCAKMFNPNIKVLIGYSQDFVASDKCKTVAENLIAQGAQVLFQVAGGCGLGTLKAADAAGIWGIGVDKDQYNDANRVLTSGVKRVDNGVFAAIKQVSDGKFRGGGNLLFNLKNKGMDVGKINPAVPKAFIDKMNELKQKIISGQVKVPAML
jgi:basic membrane protein A and related proteins